MRARTRSDDTADVDMTPMLDIVFIMLIFFIVTAVFLSEEGLDFTQAPPDATQTQTVRPSIVVGVTAAGCSVDGRALPCERAVVGVEAQLAEKPDAAVAIRVSADSRHHQLVRLRDDLARARLDSVIEVVRGAGRTSDVLTDA